MSADFEQKEYEFLAHLKADTGRDLDEWMSVISAQNLDHRNDIIDWLRQQGFIFARASWLERIHHNGGQPIYLTTIPNPVETSAPPPTQLTTAPSPRPFAPNLSTVEPANDTQPASSPVSAPPARPSPDLEDLIAKAKAYAPLAKFVVTQITKNIPGATASARTGYISFCNPGTFAVLAITPKQLFLGLDLDLSEIPLTPPWLPPRFPATAIGLPQNISHMAELDDARQIDDQLLTQVRTSHLRRNT